MLQPDREVAVPLGSLCRSAMARRPDDPRAALYDLFAERYGDEGDLFCEFCLAQYDLEEADTWQTVMARNTVAVIAINDRAPRVETAAQETFVVEEGDVSGVPDDLRPMVQAALTRQQTGFLSFHPIPPPTRQPRRGYGYLVPVLILWLAALVWVLSSQT